MILDQTLTPEQQRRSQRNLHCFNVINGVSYMCLGETILILLAVKLHSPDYVVATLGSMIYFGFLLLPLGKAVTARVGAARAQAHFWVYRNLAALAIASAALWSHLGLHLLAELVIVAGAFMFYGFRAAGVVMSQPLIGDITDESSRGRFLGLLNSAFSIACIVTLLVITLVMRHESEWTITGVIVFGACCGITASGFLRRVDETRAISVSAREPYGPAFRWALHHRPLRSLLLAAFMANLAQILIAPLSMLAVKRGYGFNDTQALIFAIGQFGGAAAISFLAGQAARLLGSRREMLLAYLGMLLIALSWLLLPNTASLPLLLILFFFVGGCNVVLINTVMQYFLEIITPERRVASSVFVSIITGAGAGVTGIIVSNAMLKLGALLAPETPLSGYRAYFALIILCLLPGLYLIARLKPAADDNHNFKRPKFAADNHNSQSHDAQ